MFDFMVERFREGKKGGGKAQILTVIPQRTRRRPFLRWWNNIPLIRPA